MTGAVSLYEKAKRSLSNIAPAFLFALLIAQPLLDIISYWANEWEFTTLTTLVRFGMFAMVMLYCFIISDKKWTYFATAGVFLAYLVLHVIACVKSAGGYEAPFTDMNNFFRTIHLPAFTVAFITIFKKKDIVPRYVQAAFFINMAIMMHALILSYMTGTQIYTYGSQGLMGWCAVHNSQSAILAFILPLILLFAYKTKKKSVFYVSSLVCFVNLFFVGTKVDYFAIFIIAFGMMFFLLISGEKKLFYYAVLFVLSLVCALSYNQSIAFDVKLTYSESMEIKQEWVEQSMEPEEGEAPLPNNISWDIYNQLDPIKKREIRELYDLCLGPVIQEYGFERVFEKYNFSIVVSDLTAARQMKRYFAEMAFEDASTLEKLFGYEYETLIVSYEWTTEDGRTVYVPYVYDLENDFPSVFYYSGYVGFAIYMLFLAYFVGLMIVSLITRFKKTMTVENGAVAITFAMMVGASQFSGNVLRRPNVSIYMSAILAYIYYQTVIKENLKYSDLFRIFKKKKDL